MRSSLIISILFFITTVAVGQSTQGITNIPDTSFSLQSEYVKLQKNWPEIRMAPDQNLRTVREQRDVAYCNAGRELKLDVFYPSSPARKKRIAIIIIHGGGWRSGNKRIHHPLARQLASKGYVCITPEYRLSTEALFPAGVYDVKAAIRWVRANSAKYNIDTTAIVAAGHSAGGELAAFMGATNGNLKFEEKKCNSYVSSKVNAVVDMDGLLAFIHPESGEGDDSQRRSAATNWFGYSKTENAAVWKEGSPLTHAGASHPPILFLNSAVDRMHAGRDDLIRILDRYNVYSEVKTFKGAPHSFCLYNPWFDSTVNIIDQFMYKVFPSIIGHSYDAKNYRNPIIHADYSDPDVIRQGDDFYMVASSFNHVPGLPILQSKDLVHWKLIGHALSTLKPVEHFSKVQHGGGVWAPSIRFHNGEYYIYSPDPDFGIYLSKSKNISGPWSDPILVESGKGLIDPCPLWDDNGKAYLVHAYAGSRAGIKSIIVVKEMSADGSRVINKGQIVYDGHEKDPTIEGPKFYKRNGYYYIFAPAGGVSTGWQTVLRSQKVYGPYERKVVMDQGTSKVNGPHQGAWVDTKAGENWFIHFQDKDAYGRIIHLQPLRWVDNWPVIGEDKDGDGKGEPVMSYKNPLERGAVEVLATSDEFGGVDLGLQWQWQANPKPYWSFLQNGALRLYAVQLADSSVNYWNVPNLLMQKFPAEEFAVTTKLSFKPRLEGEKAGLIIFGEDYAYLSVVKKGKEHLVSFSVCKKADKGSPESVTVARPLKAEQVYFRVTVGPAAVCRFSYSEDGQDYQGIGEAMEAKPGRWVGAKMGLFCTGTTRSNDVGYADVEWFRVDTNMTNTVN